MKLNQNSIDEFKDFIIQSVNEDVYYQLKEWIHNYDDDEGEDNFDTIMDYFIANLHGSLQWVETETYRPHSK